ncbi:MAG: hypothetical protein WCK49_08220, partial [Myxococcaceae bacterium]
SSVSDVSPDKSEANVVPPEPGNSSFRSDPESPLGSEGIINGSFSASSFSSKELSKTPAQKLLQEEHLLKRLEKEEELRKLYEFQETSILPTRTTDSPETFAKSKYQLGQFFHQYEQMRRADPRILEAKEIARKNKIKEKFRRIIRNVVDIKKAAKQLESSPLVQAAKSHQSSIANLGDLLGGIPEEIQGQQQSLLNSLPKYLRGDSDSWKPIDVSKGLFRSFLSWFRETETADKKAVREASEALLNEAQTTGYELREIRIDSEILGAFESNETELNNELGKLNNSKEKLALYIEKLNDAKTALEQLENNQEATALIIQIQTEIKSATAQQEQIEAYILKESAKEFKNLRLKARINANPEELRTRLSAAIDTRIGYLKQQASKSKVEQPNNEALFHQAVSDIYLEFVEHKNATDFITRFTRAVQVIANQRREKTPLLESNSLPLDKHWSDTKHWDRKIRADSNYDAKITQINTKKLEIPGRDNAAIAEINKLQQSMSSIAEQLAVNEDIRTSLENRLADKKYELSVFQEHEHFVDSLSELQQQYIEQAKTHPLTDQQIKIQRLLGQETLSANETNELFELIGKEPKPQETVISAILIYRDSIGGKALEVLHIEQQLSLLNQLGAIHLQEREQAFRQLYRFRQERLGLEIETNNLRTRWLALQRQEIKFKLETLGKVKKKTDENTNELQNLELKLGQLNDEQNKLNLHYRKALLELQKLANSENQRREDSTKHLETQSIWEIVKNFLVPDKIDLNEEFQQIASTRQLALNGLETIVEAVKSVSTTFMGALRELPDLKAEAVMASTPKNLEDFAKIIKKLDDWVSAHPLEAQRFAGNLQHTYDILKQKGFPVTVMNRASTENIAKSWIQGSREHIAAASETDVMPPELLGLLYMADWLPAATQMSQALLGNTAAGSTAFWVGSLLGGPIFGAAAALGAGYLQASSEQGAAKAIARNTEAEMTINALITGVNAEGSIKQKSEAFVQSILLRKTAEAAGTLKEDMRAKGVLGGIKRFFNERATFVKEGVKQLWNGSKTDKASAVAGIAVAAFLGGVTAAGVVVAWPIIVGAAAAGAIVGGIILLAKYALFPSADIAERERRKMTDLRMQETERDLNNALRTIETEHPDLDEKLKKHGIDKKILLENVKKELKKQDLTAAKVSKEFREKLITEAQLSPAGASLNKDPLYWNAQADILEKVMEAEFLGTAP